jgi:Uma2 family endonuclease
MDFAENLPTPLRRWTVDDFDRMTEAGLLALRGYELLDGVVYNTSGYPRRWSLGDYERMVNAGILTWEERAELVEGFVVSLPPAQAVQASIHCRSTSYLIHLFKDDTPVVSSAGHHLVFDDENLACPDLCILKGTIERYRDAWPRGEDVLLTMDVSASPLILGTNARRRQLARFHVPEYWHVDGRAKLVTLHKLPADAGYTIVRGYGHGESFTSDVLGGIEIPVDALIGSAKGVDW